MVNYTRLLYERVLVVSNDVRVYICMYSTCVKKV